MNYKISSLYPFGTLIEATRPNTSLDEIETTLLKGYFQKSQLILLRGFSPFKDAIKFSDYCEKWGEVSVWPFGKVLELVKHETPKDHIFDNSYVPFHWDGMYRKEVPEYQFFHCVKAPIKGHGGRTTFSNTKMILEALSPNLKNLFSKVIGVYEREMEFYKSKITSPIIVKHPLRDYFVIRYNELHSEERGELINIPNINFHGVDSKELDLFHTYLKDLLYDSRYFYAHEWQDGDIVIADNFTLLHGREAYKKDSLRHIRRVQVLSHPPYKNPGLESYYGN